MLNTMQSPFNEGIPATCQVVFVADLFEDDYVGGAELTTQALIDSCRFNSFKIKSKNLTLNHIKQGLDKFWIFGNFSQINPALIAHIVANLRYSILEYDYKFCLYRSPEKHEFDTGNKCNCETTSHGKMIAAFFENAKALWWMSEKQMNIYHGRFNQIKSTNNFVLSSVFSPKTLGKIKLLRKEIPNKRSGWIILGSTSWIKGFDAAKKWCQDNGITNYEVVWNIPYDEMLAKFSQVEGFVYLPLGADTCPRMVIEAKLLGCNLVLNDNVQHSQEEWFNTNNIDEIEEYLYCAPSLFWNFIDGMVNYIPTISGYTTTFNCINQDYPFEQCIKSIRSFCDEVCVVDAGSSDGTWEKLQALSQQDEKIKISQIKQDTSNPRFAVKIDGLLKAAARKMCSSDFCWQMDSDEVVDVTDSQKIKNLCKIFPTTVDILSLPVIEYWGRLDKVRIDITPWKWRLSRNKPNIIHGIPKELRKYDENGELFSAPGSDSCDLIDDQTGVRINHVAFITRESEMTRLAALQGNQQALIAYQNWFDEIVSNLPSVHHYSWYDMKRKVKQYRDYWSKFWPSMYGQKFEDTAENNVMFNVPWSEVTDQMIEERSKIFTEKLGGWIWHKKWDEKTMTPSIQIKNAKDLIKNDK